MAKSKNTKNLSLEQQALAIAQQVIQQSESWTAAHNSLYGPAGKISKLFPNATVRRAFAQSPEKREIESLLTALAKRSKTPAAEGTARFSGKFVVRVPVSLHEALAGEAESEGVSLNQLVLTKLAVQLREAV
jgi:predicted HicB family RNase H-like nuclease